MDQVKLMISDTLCDAIEAAFEEAKARMTSGMTTFDPFTVTVVDGGIEFNDHPCESPEAVHESVRMLLAMDMPEGYVLCYDGFVELDEGTVDAVIVEAADRGVPAADCLALLYTEQDGVYTFENDYGYAGNVVQLYPAGTKPIVSGLKVLADEDALNAALDSDIDAEYEEFLENEEQGDAEPSE